MRIQVLYFAAARERAGLSREELEVPEGASVRAAVELIASRHPGLRELLPHLRIAVNQEFGREEDALPKGAELALIPPVAGGAGLFLVVDLVIDDFHALQILLNDLFTRKFDILVGVFAGAFSNTVDHMFLYENTNLFGQIGSR